MTNSTKTLGQFPENKMTNAPLDTSETLPPRAISKEASESATESIFELALRARNERATRPTARVAKAPSRIRATKKIKGWFRTHDNIYGPFQVFHPKDEGGFSEDPIFIMPDLADQLRAEGTQFQNAICDVVGYLAFTMGGALYLVLTPLPDPATGRNHPAIEQKIDALEAARRDWKRLDWNKGERQFDDLTAVGMADEPKWPDDVSEVAILTRAFGERNVIQSLDDPLLVKFRGEA